MNNSELKNLANDLVSRGYGNYGFTSTYEKHMRPSGTVWCDDMREIGVYDNGSLILHGFSAVEERTLKAYIKEIRGY